tara:strand:+ start:484 stop:678 length:195 start_codon:yes stop_codon:yes gene_type:complete
MDVEDQAIVEYSGPGELWWVAHPSRVLVDNVDVGDVVGEYRVLDVVVACVYKKKVAIVALKHIS